MDKIWKPLLENYEISNYGEIYSKKYNKLLTPWKTGKGYLKIDLGRSVRKYVHRLVAETFLTNNENKKTVNHIDHNKLNNRTDNLEWMTYKEQTCYDIKMGKRGTEKGDNGRFQKKD